MPKESYLEKTLQNIISPPRKSRKTRIKRERWQPITIRFREEEFAKLGKVAAAENRSISGMVREVVVQYLKEKTL